VAEPGGVLNSAWPALAARCTSPGHQGWSNLASAGWRRQRLAPSIGSRRSIALAKPGRRRLILADSQSFTPVINRYIARAIAPTIMY
jgi:hypothetical protein